MYVICGLLDAAGAALLAFPMITDMEKFLQRLERALALTERLLDFKKITSWLIFGPFFLFEVIAMFHVAAALPDTATMRALAQQGAIVKLDIPYLIPLIVAMFAVPCVLLLLYFFVVLILKYLRRNATEVLKHDSKGREMHVGRRGIILLIFGIIIQLIANMVSLFHTCVP